VNYDDPTPHAQDCIEAVLGGPSTAALFAEDTGYTVDEVYAVALATAILGFDPSGGAYATGYDLLYSVQEAVAAYHNRTAA
jgi:hypothetical protein